MENTLCAQSDYTQKTKAELIFLLQNIQQNHQKEIQQQNNLLSQQAVRIETLEQRLALALQARFGSRSESLMDANQINLFDEADIEPEALTEIEAAELGITVASFTRKKAGRKPLPAHLPREEILYDLPEEQKHCACGCKLTEIGADKSEQLDIIPAQVKVLVHVRKKYACKACEDTIKTAELPKQAIPKSMAAPGLLAHVLVSKYEDHLPLYRQEDILQRMGIDIPRSTLSYWIIQCGELLKPLIPLMKTVTLNYDVAYADETKVQVLKEKDRKAETQSFMWFFSGGPPDQRCSIYEYHPTRGGIVAREFFKDYTGYLHCDAYAGYDALFDQPSSKILPVGCWAHARRNFIQIKKANPNQAGFADEVLTLIQKLYHLEKRAKEEGYTPEQVHQMRQEKSRAILLDLKARIEDKLLKAPPESLIAKAMGYVINQWEKLMGYLKDPRCEIDNNFSERGIKDFVIGRKNWLFSDQPEGAHAGAVIYSLMQTCKLHGVEPYAYFRDVLTKLPTIEPENLHTLLPFHYAK